MLPGIGQDGTSLKDLERNTEVAGREPGDGFLHSGIENTPPFFGRNPQPLQFLFHCLYCGLLNSVGLLGGAWKGAGKKAHGNTVQGYTEMSHVCLLLFLRLRVSPI